MTVVVASCPDALMRSNNSRPASEGEPIAETWSVSRTSNLFFVGLLLPILASEPLGFPRYLVVGHAANGAAPILFEGPQLEDLRAQLSDLLLEVFHAFFKCLRHAGKIEHCSREIHHEMQPHHVRPCLKIAKACRTRVRKGPPLPSPLLRRRRGRGFLRHALRGLTGG